MENKVSVNKEFIIVIKCKIHYFIEQILKYYIKYIKLNLYYLEQ